MVVDWRSALRLTLILVAAVALAAALARELWTRLSTQLSVRTDMVGYPTFANFNIDRYYERYWLVVAVVPLLTLGLFLVMDLFVPGRRSRPTHERTSPQQSELSTAPRWATAGRSAFVGAILALEIAILVRREPDWIWSIGLPAVVLYGALIGAVGRWFRLLPGTNAWERSAAANALATPLLVVGLLATASRTKVIGPDREWSYDWLPAWFAIALFLTALGWIVAQIARRITPPVVDRRAALAISGPVAIFLSISFLPGALGPMDMFHDGESLAAAELVRHGAFPWRDLMFIHGLLNDVLSPLVGTTIFEDSRWGAAAGGYVLLVPLYWLAIYAFCVYMFRSNWLFLLATQVAVFAAVAGIRISELDFLFGTEVRFLLLPFVLISLIALLRRATPVRAASFAGITLVQTILSPEAAIAGVIFLLAVIAYELIERDRNLALIQNFRRTALTAGFGSIQLGIWCAFLAWHGALDDFFNAYLTFSSSHELTGGIPVYGTGAAFSRAMYVPPAAALAMVGLVTVRLIRRQRISAEDWGVGAMALFVLVYYHKFLTRPDSGHVFQLAAVSVPLVLYVVFRLVGAVDNLLTRIAIPDRDLKVPRRATIAVLVLVVAVNAAVIGRTLQSLPTRLEASVNDAPELDKVGFATPGAVDKTLVRDLREIGRFYLESGDTVFDFTNSPALFHYILGLRPATRYYHVSLAIRRKTQLDLIDELEQKKPKLVFFTGTAPVGLPEWDGVSNPIRHYDVSEWILRRYRPIAESHGFLLMVPKAARTPPLARLGRRLTEAPTTSLLYDRSPPCNWGYAPNFLTTGPDDKGTALSITPQNEGLFTVRGWAVDTDARAPAKLVLVADGQRIVAWATPNISRPDVQQSLGGEFLRSGFELEFARSRIKGLGGAPGLANLRLYGLLQDGRAQELAYGAFAGWRPTSPLPARLTLGGWRIPVANEAAQGAVDESAAGVVSVRVPPLARYNWLELESPRTLAANDFMISTDDRPTVPLTFSTLGRGERRIRVQTGACSQWFGYHGRRLLIRSRVDPNITAVRLYR